MKKRLLLLNATFFIVAVITNANARVTNQMDMTSVVKEGEFKKVDSSELTPAVVEQILKEYPTSKLAAVYKNDKGQFKLIMILPSGYSRTVYIDQYGRWFKPKR